MKISEHTEIDFKKWDEIILSSETPWVFAQSFYLNAVCPGWSAIISEDNKAVMPLTIKKKFGINYLMQPPFTPQLGLFGSYNESEGVELISYLKNKFKYIAIELNSGNTFINSEPKNKKTYIIDFRKPFVYNSNTKRNIAKANKLNLKCVEIDDGEIKTYTKKLLHPFLKNKLLIKPKQIKIFDQLLHNAINEKCLKSFVVIDENEKVSALAHFIYNEKHVVYLKGKSVDKSANSGSMHFLMDKAIEYFEYKNIRIFDFGGGQSDSLAQFYSGFGAKPLTYSVFNVNNLPKAIKWLKK